MPALLEKDDGPGAAVAVIARDGTVWSRGYGRTRRGKGRPGTDDTLFGIMSCSKGVAALSALLAAQDGLVDLDAPLAAALPDFAVRSDAVSAPTCSMTLRQPLAHRSGPDNDLSVDELTRRPHNLVEYVGHISGTWAALPHGYRPLCSNIGFDLAAYAIESRTAVSFARFVSERITKPLGMGRTTYDLRTAERDPDRASGHWDRTEDRDKQPPLYLPGVASTGLYSTVADMARYLRLLLNGGSVGGAQIVRRELLDEMDTLPNPMEGQRTGYTVGLERSTAGDAFYLHQEGGGFGFQSQVLVFPQHGFAVAVLARSCWTWLTDGIARTVIGVVEAGSGGAAAAPDPFPTAGDVAAPTPAVRKVLGVYDGGITLSESGDGAVLATKRRTYPLRLCLRGGRLVGRAGGAYGVSFLAALPDAPGKMALVDLRRGTARYVSHNRPLPADDVPGPGRPTWRKLTGEYRLLFAGTERARLEVRIGSGYLTLSGLLCREERPGLFFTPEGTALDFTSDPPTLGTYPLTKTDNATASGEDVPPTPESVP